MADALLIATLACGQGTTRAAGAPARLQRITPFVDTCRALLRRARRAGLLGLGLACCAALAQPTPAEPITIRDDSGTEHRFAAPPQRIITMLPSLTELTWVLGAGPRLVGVDRFSNWPDAVTKLPHLGGLDDAQIEGIAALKPDVILASTASRAMDRLTALGFTVLRFKSDSHPDVRRTLDTLARLLGTPDEGAKVWSRLDREVAAAAARVPAGLRGQRVYFEIGSGPYAAGPGSFIGETLARLGMNNIVPADLGPFPKLNPEFIVRAKPDIIMGARREQANLIQRPGWRMLDAVRSNRLCGYDDDAYELLTRPGPRLGEAAKLLSDCLARLATAPRSIATPPR